MSIYFIQCVRKQLDEFERLRDIIKFKKSTKEVVDITTAMLKSIENKHNIEFLSKKYRNHFSSSAISWQMEYDIASKILAKESKEKNLTYTYELINYCFYFLLLPPNFRNTFFLLHGMVIEQDIAEWNILVSKVRNKRYIVYKGGQELLNSFLFNDEILNKEYWILIDRLYRYYNNEAPSSVTTDCENIFVIQSSNRKQ